MTVLNGARPAARQRSLLGSALANMAPKPRRVDRPSRRQRFAAWLGRNSQRVRDGAVMAVATGCPTVAAFEWHTWAGLCAAGLAVVLTDLAVDWKAGEPR